MSQAAVAVISLALLLGGLPRVPAGEHEDPTKHTRRKPKPIWSIEQCRGQMDKYRMEIARLRTELASERQLVQAQGGEVKLAPGLFDQDADHGPTLFLTMCAGSSHFDLYCGPFFASFERAYGAAARKHRVVAFTLHVPQRILGAAQQRFAPWGRFENLTSYVTDADIDGGTEQHYGEQTEMESGSIVCKRDADGKRMCEVPEAAQDNRDKKTQLDSLWFPNAVAAYMETHGAGFRYAVLIDSDTLFVGPLGQFLPAYSIASDEGSRESSDGPPDWDVAFTVYDPEFQVPWNDDPAEAGRTVNGYSRINCGVVLLNLESLETVLRFLKKWTHVSAVLTEVNQAVHKDADVQHSTYAAASQNLSIWFKWQHELVAEFRGNDQAGLALLVSSYRTQDLQHLLGWGERCLLCQASWPAELKCYAGESPLTVRFRALPARILNHPEAMVNGAFPPGLRIVHLKGLWWRVAVGKGIMTSTVTREPYWAREAMELYLLSQETWQQGIPKDLRVQSSIVFTDSRGNDITQEFWAQAKAFAERKALEKAAGEEVQESPALLSADSFATNGDLRSG